MHPPGRQTAFEHSQPWLAVLAAALLLGCTSFASRDQQRRESLALEANELSAALAAPGAFPLVPGSARVRLAFGAGADLDLYVTGPDHETVYFANTPSRAGGALERDLRCDAASPRIEVVKFDRAPPGAYRVGVDFPERCGRADAVAFVVVFEAGSAREERRRSIAPGHFLPVVMVGEVE